MKCDVDEDECDAESCVGNITFESILENRSADLSIPCNTFNGFELSITTST